MPARQAAAIQGLWTVKDASHSSETRAAPEPLDGCRLPRRHEGASGKDFLAMR